MFRKSAVPLGRVPIKTNKVPVMKSMQNPVFRKNNILARNQILSRELEIDKRENNKRVKMWPYMNLEVPVQKHDIYSLVY